MTVKCSTVCRRYYLKLTSYCSRVDFKIHSQIPLLPNLSIQTLSICVRYSLQIRFNRLFIYSFVYLVRYGSFCAWFHPRITPGSCQQNSLTIVYLYWSILNLPLTIPPTLPLLILLLPPPPEESYWAWCAWVWSRSLHNEEDLAH
jgi:hypothetical protein